MENRMSEAESPPVPSDLYPYLNEIAERLFSGHAAVMIGSGFSRNAQPRAGSSPEFPDWSGLGDLLYEKLYHKQPDAESKYLSVRMLANEVEATFGRAALDRILQSAIPDQDHEPAALHIALLDFPWSDVFTTNYDTLLERACISVANQKYGIVIDQHDLINSDRPRIVKLHGSLSPAFRLIVTEEDYRRYPEDHAPFVNTVRQALLENTLCLIGFSGEDPNFLQWIGWIADNLGRRDAPKMYLLGVHRLSDSRKKLLDERNIVYVDLSQYPDIGVDDHNKALHRLFDYLDSRRKDHNRSLSDYVDSRGRDYNRLRWPHDDNDHTKEKDETIASQISTLVPTWRDQRRSYPGWVIVPDDRRVALWQSTRKWVRKPPAPDSLPDSLDLEFAFELIWRMEKCQCPIFDSQIGFLELTLNRYLPLAGSDAPTDSSSSGPKDAKLPRSVGRDMCQHLLLAVLRYYREEGLQEKWDGACEKIEGLVATMSPDYRARFHYERALAALFAPDPQDVKKKIEEWPVDDSLPFWEAKRAGLLAEIGQLQDAARILESSLAAIRTRSNLKPVTTDYSLVSQEAIVMFLLRSVQLALVFPAGELSKYKQTAREFTDRWHALRQFGCDPWGEIEAFELALDRPQEHKQNATRKPTFDIGRVTQNVSFQSEDKETLTAYRFLRFCEDAGVPFQMPGCTIATKTAAGALSRVAPQSPYWAMATLIRLNDAKAVERLFDRASLARMDTTSVDGLVERYLGALDLALADIQAGTHIWDQNLGILLAKVVPEILSRLCCKCSPSTKSRLLDFLTAVYRSDRRGYYDGIRHLTQRLLEALSVHQRIDAIPRLLALPILTALNGLEELEYKNPFLFLEIERDSMPNTIEVNERDLQQLIKSASSDNPKARRWAVFTLGKLYEWRLLGQCTDQFADALWDRLDDAGMPSDTDYYRFAFLTLPHPTQYNPVSIFKNWVLNARFPVQAGRKSISVPVGGGHTPCNEIVGAAGTVTWSSEEAATIVHRLVEWWDADKSLIKDAHDPEPIGSLTAALRQRFSHLVDALVAVISPSFNPIDGSGTRDSLERVARELPEHGLPALRVESAYVHLVPEKRSDLLQRIEEAIASSTEATVIDGLQAVWVTAMRIDAAAEPQAKSDLLRILGVTSQVLRWRREQGLPLAINTVAGITKMHPWTFAADIERSVLEGLHHLIEETAIHPPSGLHLYADDGREVATKLMVRRAAAGLAYTLSNHYQQCGAPAPAVIGEWAAICRSDDEFAEVRNQWMAPDPV